MFVFSLKKEKDQVPERANLIITVTLSLCALTHFTPPINATLALASENTAKRNRRK